MAHVRLHATEHAGATDPLTGTGSTSFQIDADNSGPKLVNSGGSLQVTSAADALLASFSTVASAVNRLDIVAAIASSHPSVQSAGSDTNINIDLIPKGTGVVRVDPTGAAGGEIQLLGNTSGYVGFKAAAAAGSNVWALPTTAGSNGNYLKNNGDGTLSWDTPSAGAAVWSAITAPVADLAMDMNGYKTAFTWDTTPGTSSDNLFSFVTTAAVAGTGYVVNIESNASSTNPALRVASGGVDALTVNAAGDVAIHTFSQATAPTAGDIAAGCFAFWIDTDDSTLWFVYNQAGSIKMVELTA